MNIASMAILPIDLQNEYRAEGNYPVEGYDAVLANAASIIAAARRVGRPVIHVQAWTPEEGRDRHPLHLEGLPEHLRSGVGGSVAAAICAEVAPLAEESVVHKRLASGFQHTALESLLRGLGITDLLAFGVWTDSCVRGTILDAVACGFRVWLVKDACGSGTVTMHRAGTLDIANRLHGGGVLTAAAAVEALAGQPYHVGRYSRPVAFQYRLDTIDAFYEAL